MISNTSLLCTAKYILNAIHYGSCSGLSRFPSAVFLSVMMHCIESNGKVIVTYVYQIMLLMYSVTLVKCNIV